MLTRLRIVVACASALMLGACAAPAAKSDSTTAGASAGTLAAPSVAEVRSAIEAANQRASAAMVAGDLAGSLANYADSAVVMMTGMPMMAGRAAIEAGFKGMMDMMTMNAVTFTTRDVMVSGDMAVETGMYDMTTTMKGAKPVTDKGKYLTLWTRQADGGWKAVRDINNSDGPPPK